MSTGANGVPYIFTYLLGTISNVLSRKSCSVTRTEFIKLKKDTT